MLSIPRDLWVPIPGYGEGRINTAHFLGDAKKYPGGGPALAKKAVQYNLGVPVHYYVRVNFDGFRQAIDILGGITIDVEESISDSRYPDENYGYKSIYIPAGQQNMDGEMALQYARTRHGGSDFTRAKRQQQVLLAIRERVLSLDLLATLPVRLPSLMRTLEGTIQTDLQPGEILALAQLASKIPSENIKSSVIDQNLTLPWRTPQGADVLIPNREKIRLVVDELFAASAPEVAEPVTEIVSEVASEGTTIEVLNGTTRASAEQEIGAMLSQQGFQVVRIGQADRLDYDTTIIIDYADKMQSLALLTGMFGVAPENVRHAQNPNSDVDIRLIVGSDIPLTQ
jgi:LCP family protein required for cell wall assembly